MQIFIERLRELRTEKGMSQKELARLLNTTNSSVCDWERGRSEPNLETVALIARRFEVSADYLLGLEDESGARQ